MFWNWYDVFVFNEDQMASLLSNRLKSSFNKYFDNVTP